MKVENLSKAMYIKEELNELEGQYRLVVSGAGLGVTIQSTYQDDDFVNAVRAAVTGELSRRIGAAKRELTELGITFR